MAPRTKIEPTAGAVQVGSEAGKAPQAEPERAKSAVAVPSSTNSAPAAKPKIRVAQEVPSKPAEEKPAPAVAPVAREARSTPVSSQPKAQVQQPPSRPAQGEQQPKVRVSAQQTSQTNPPGPSPATPAQESGQGERVTLGSMQKSASGWVARTFPGHEHAFYGALIALVVALLVFAIGVLRVLFIAVLVLVGVAVGQMLDGDPKIIAAIRELFSNDRGSNG